MNKRQRKKKEKKELNKRWCFLVEFVPRGDEPCDDLTCRSCYVQEIDRLLFPILAE